jgi:hypothetical protein
MLLSREFRLRLANINIGAKIPNFLSKIHFLCSFIPCHAHSWNFTVFRFFRIGNVFSYVQAFRVQD